MNHCPRCGGEMVPGVVSAGWCKDECDLKPQIPTESVSGYCVVRGSINHNASYTVYTGTLAQFKKVCWRDNLTHIYRLTGMPDPMPEVSYPPEYVTIRPFAYTCVD